MPDAPRDAGTVPSRGDALGAATAVAVTVRVGEVVAGYAIDALAGAGGMGVVYRATEVENGRAVALKLIAPERAGDPALRELFVRESLTATRLEHPNVLPIYRAGEDDGRLFIAMRFVEGQSLHELIAASPGGVPPGRAARILARVADALDAAHARGLVHRDVKPANILIADPRRRGARLPHRLRPERPQPPANRPARGRLDGNALLSRARADRRRATRRAHRRLRARLRALRRPDGPPALPRRRGGGPRGAPLAGPAGAVRAGARTAPGHGRGRAPGDGQAPRGPLRERRRARARGPLGPVRRGAPGLRVRPGGGPDDRGRPVRGRPPPAGRHRRRTRGRRGRARVRSLRRRGRPRGARRLGAVGPVRSAGARGPRPRLPPGPDPAARRAGPRRPGPSRTSPPIRGSTCAPASPTRSPPPTWCARSAAPTSRRGCPARAGSAPTAAWRRSARRTPPSTSGASRTPPS